MTWVVAVDNPDSRTQISHLDGVPWDKADRPKAWHRCRAQSKGWINYFTYVERCACGAFGDGRGWTGRNSR